VELVQYWRLIVQNRILVAISTLLGVIVATVITFTTTPLYESKAEIFVSTPASTLDISALATGSSFSQQRVKSYAQIINSPLTLEPVIRELNLKMSATELAEMISASAPLDTVLIQLTVTDTDPERGAEIANAVADQFAVTVSDLELSGFGIDSPVKVSTVEGAIPADAPASPKKAINLALGLLLGFGLGIGLASLRRLLDNTVKNEDDLMGTPLLAAIGFDPIADEKPLITQIGRYAARTEAFRTLRTNLQFLNPDAHPQVIVMTSALPNEGKSTSSINLSLSLVQAGAKVVLVEADLRRPKAPIYLEMSSKLEGLSDLISGSEKITAQRVKSRLHAFESTGLKVLLSGKVPPNPSELLGSNRFDELIAVLRTQFEYVIIDCPPLLPVSDAAIVSAKADGCVLVIHAGVTKKPHFVGSRDAVKAVGSTILGVIINKIPESSLEYEYGYRYGYPRYYGASYRPYAKRSLDESIYAPSPDVLERQALEDNFEHIKGQRFKDELRRQDSRTRDPKRV
jgi:succinoglycan biosynthesis transport protein ExoP